MKKKSPINMLDLFYDLTVEKRKKLDMESESFIKFLHSLPEDSVRKIHEFCWLSFGEKQSRIVVFGFSGIIGSYCCPSIVAHRIMCAL